MKLYVMRHGQTIWNVIGRSQGRSNNRLSKMGVTQANDTAMKYANTHFDVVIASPLFRTIQTVNIMNQYHHNKILKDDRIIEINQGIYSGIMYKDMDDEQKKRKGMRLAQDGMESYKDVYDRTMGFFNEIKSKYADKSILIVTHNVVASCIEYIISYGDYDENKINGFGYFDNAQLKEFEI